jgi:putative transposase
LPTVVRYFDCQREEAVHPIKWKAKYGGMQVSDAKQLGGLEDENRRLKKLLAEAMLDNAALKDLLGKNG